MMKKNIPTIAGLASMINEGFKHTATTARLDSVEPRLGRIETLLIEEQKRKIENLKTRMKKLEDPLAI
jgi:hypothetical protein